MRGRYARESPPRFFGLEGQPSIARGEPRFAAEPRVHGRPPSGGRAQDLASLGRQPSPQQPAARARHTRRSNTHVQAVRRG
jgi:hypothetical protein